MLLYTVAVYAWSLGVGPLGRDYQLLAAPERLSGFVEPFWRAESTLFGSNAVAYLCLNILLLYASMLLVYRLTNRAVQGQWWLGTLAAVLYMANPVHTEAVLNLSGSTDLVPALLALAALVAYAEHAAAPSTFKYALALALFAFASWSTPVNAGLVLILLLWELIIVDPSNRSRKRLLPFLLVALLAWFLYRHALQAADHSFAQMFSPLYFIFYPIGFLPETAQRFHAHPGLGWFAGAVVAAILLAIYWKARRPAILFGLLAMLAIRLYPGDRSVDPVHLVGGGQLLLPNVFFNIALVALFLRIMDHPRWRIPVVSGTTFLALVFFILMFRSEWAWRQASAEVRAFQTQAEQEWSQGETLGVLPDYRYFRTAPLCLSDSIAHDTPFSRRIPHESLLKLNRPHATPPHIEQQGNAPIKITGRTPDAITVSLDRSFLREAAPWPYDLVPSPTGSAPRVEYRLQTPTPLQLLPLNTP